MAWRYHNETKRYYTSIDADASASEVHLFCHRKVSIKKKQQQPNESLRIGNGGFFA
jgi:hypothetical protein